MSNQGFKLTIISQIAVISTHVASSSPHFAILYF